MVPPAWQSTRSYDRHAHAHAAHIANAHAHATPQRGASFRLAASGKLGLGGSEVSGSAGGSGACPPPDPASGVSCPNPNPNPNPNQALNQERQEKLALRKQLGQAGPKKGKGKRSLKKK